ECSGGISLFWTAYEGYDVSVSAYDIIEVFDTNTEIIIETVSGSQTNYLVPHSNNAIRRFFIQAHIEHGNSATYISRSNMTTFNTPIGIYPNFVEIETVQLDTADVIHITIHCDSLSDFSTYL